MNEQPRCARCPVHPDRPCIALTHPESFAYLCGWAEGGDPIQRTHIVNRSAIAEQSPPTLIRRAANFVGATVRHVAAGMPEAPPEVVAERLAICRACEFYEPDGVVCKVNGCGCYLKVKTAWADQSCPLDPPKWGPVTDSSPSAQAAPDSTAD